MRKLIVAVIALAVIMSASSAFAVYRQGSTVTARSAVSTNDSAFPGTKASGINVSGYETALVEVSLGGTAPGWIVTPGYWSASSSSFASGTAVSVNGNGSQIFSLPIYGYDSLYFLCNGKTGTSPTVTIYVTPVETLSKEYIR